MENKQFDIDVDTVQMLGSTSDFPVNNASFQI